MRSRKTMFFMIRFEAHTTSICCTNPRPPACNERPTQVQALMKENKSLAAQWGSKIKNLLHSSSEEKTKAVEIPHIVRPNKFLRKKGHFHIAVITLATAPVPDEVVAGIRKELEASSPGTFTVSYFDGKSDERLLLKKITDIMRSYTMPFDAIVTIGAKASQVASRTSLYLNIPMPVIFTSIINPAHIGVIYPGKHPTQNITGITIPQVPYDRHVKVLQNLKHDVRRLLLAFDPGLPWAIQEKMGLTTLFNCSGIETLPIPVSSPQDVLAKVSSHIYDVDTVVTLRSSTTTGNLSPLINMCNNYGVTLYSADLESVQQGAAIGFASSDRNIGKETAQQILILFQEDASPHEIPIKAATMNYQVAINTKTFQKQGLTLDPTMLNSLENKILYGGDNNNATTEKDSSTD